MVANMCVAVSQSTRLCSMSVVSQAKPARAMKRAAVMLPSDNHVPTEGLPSRRARLTGLGRMKSRTGMTDVADRDKQVQLMRATLDPLYREVGRVIIGQRDLVDRLLLGLLTGGHILIEGVPGLAKTLAVRTVAQGLHLRFHRIQFTPDLLPADVIGTQIYNPRSGEFSIKKGPIFANFVLADEINRAPAKVQSALLEAMQEKQVTIGDTSYPLEQPFLVLATQNPIEQEGTYPLPEAQVDRFMLKLKIDYPSKEEELAILERMAAIEPDLLVEPVLAPD